MISARPLTTEAMPRVTISGETRNWDISTPLAAPTEAPVSMPAPVASTIPPAPGTATITELVVMLVSASAAPTERSKPPVIMTMAWAMTTRVKYTDWVAMVDMLRPLRK
ncbi:hypothetical protein KBTX_04414 [wastewater metagenome]|uniref:Uncharacterized protein n=2 Tax=unclassified sequences TaxID=12908 RepID=A0A5B8RHF6_9ZZZZ|nr:hypothetical protein KBTEX_04414 [uncultured organism]